MQRRKHVVSAICTSLLALVLAPDRPRAAPGATECLSAPNRAPDAGRHWYFHTDRTNNQKCWYLRAQDVATTGAVGEPARAQPDAAQQQPAQPSEQSASSERAQKALFRDFLRWYKERGATQ